MFNKDESKADVEIGGILKKAAVGGLFLLVIPIMVTTMTDVSLLEFCVTEDGVCKTYDDSNSNVQKLEAGWDKLTPVMVLGIDIFMVIVGLAILVGPGKQVINYRFVRKNVGKPK